MIAKFKLYIDILKVSRCQGIELSNYYVKKKDT